MLSQCHQEYSFSCDAKLCMYQCLKKVVVGGGKPTLRRQQVRRIYFMLNLVLKEPSIALVRIFNQIEKGPEDNAFCTFTIFSISLFF